MTTILQEATPEKATVKPKQQLRVLDLLRDFWVPLLGGTLLGLAFYSEHFSWLAWVALVPIAWVLRKPHASVELYLGSLYGGLSFGLLALDWIRQSYSGLFATWFVTGHFVALFLVAAIWVGRRVMNARRLPAAVVLPMFWIALEWVRWHAAAIALGDGFPFLQLGATQAQHVRLIQIADLGGIATVTCLVAAVNGLLFDSIEAGCDIRRTGKAVLRPAVFIGVAAGLVVAALSYGEWRLRLPDGEAGPTIGLVSGQFGLTSIASQADKLNRSIRDRLEAADVVGMVPQVRPGYPDLLVWKEGAASDFYFVDSSFAYSDPPPTLRAPAAEPRDESVVGHERLLAFTRQISASSIIGCMRQEHGGSSVCKYNSVVYVDGASGELTHYDKQHLALWWEFHSQIASDLGLIPAARETNPDATPSKPGSIARVFELSTDSRDYPFAIAICYDVLFPADHRALVNRADQGARPAFFVGVSDESTETESTFQRASVALQRFRAIECRRAYARNAEHGISAILDSRGRIVPSVRVDTDDGRSVLVGRTPICKEGSAYVRFGEWLPALACAFTGVLVVVSLWPRSGRLRGLPFPDASSK